VRCFRITEPSAHICDFWGFFQGLGDEAIDVDDDDEEEDDEDNSLLPGDDDEQPIFPNGGMNKATGNGSRHAKPASYGYRDVFGREYQRQRQQQIEFKASNSSLRLHAICTACSACSWSSTTGIPPVMDAGLAYLRFGGEATVACVHRGQLLLNDQQSASYP
jgi:hypothetical protein